MNGLLIVDDEEGVRRSLKKVLERDGYEVSLAESGGEAIQLVRERGEAIETVISDYKMPGIDGLETLVAIGRINPEITRIMLTGYATMESAIESVNQGIDGFLTKPFENNELRAKIREFNIKKRLKQFVPEQVLGEIQRRGKGIQPISQTVTVVFTDIRGFTEIAEGMTPEEVARFLNLYYFSPLDGIILEHNGTLDKHIGDGIMSLFGAPVAGPDDALRAVRSAIGMRDEIVRINKRLRGHPKELAIGIGIATGEVMAGIFGSHRKKEYTVFGAAVNLAARLIGASGANQILVCERTWERVRDAMDAVRLDPFPIRGIKRQVAIYEIRGEREEPRGENRLTKGADGA